MSDACCSNRGRIATVIVAILVLPLVYNGWTETVRSWRTCRAVSVHLERSQAALAQQQYGQAVAEANRAWGLAPTDQRIAPALSLARMYLIAWQPDTELRNVDLDQALVDAATVERYFPAQKASVLAFRGLIARNRLAIDEATGLFENALTLDATNPIAHMGLALDNSLDVNDADSFIEHMTIVAKAQKDTPHVFARLGAAFRTIGDLPAANEWFKQAVAKRAEPDWLADLAIIELELGKTDDAVKTARQATLIGGRNSMAWAALGRALLSKQDPEAVSALQNSVSLQEDVNNLAALGAALNMIGNYNAAAAALQKAASGGNREPTVLMELGTAMEGVGSYQDAIRIYQSLANMQARKEAGEAEQKLVSQIVAVANERLTALQDKQPAPRK